MLQHPWFWERLGARAPLVCAPMGGAAGGRLAAAVSAAGAVGMIGLGSSGSPQLFARELAAWQAHRSGSQLGVGLVGWLLDRYPKLLDEVLASGPSLLSVSFGEHTGDTPDWVSKARDMNVLTVTQVATADEAKRAYQSGVDALVARGFEGGGHGDPAVTRDELLTEILEAVPSTVPVLAAGAISDAATVRHVLSLGASGVWVGTAFIACPESLMTDDQREIVLAAGNGDTRVTREYDIAAGLPWPERFPERVISGTPVNAGMGVGGVRSVRSAAEVVRELRG